MGEQDAGLLDDLRAEYGDALRVLASYTRDGYTLHYVSEQVATTYTADDLAAIYDDVLLGGLQHGFHEDLFHDLGDVRGTIRLFDHGVVALFWPPDGDEGIFMALDRSVDPSIWTLHDLVADYYDEE